MTVYCSYCSTGYLLPDHLLGPRGARVRCPKCGKTFVVLRDPPAGATPAPPEPGVLEVEPLEAPERTAAAASDIVPGSGYGAASVGFTGTAPVAAAGGGDQSLALELLDRLASECGSRLAEARGRGRVLAEFGPDLMRTYEQYRRQAGSPDSLLAFKQVLRDRWGVDLITGIEA